MANEWWSPAPHRAHSFAEDPLVYTPGDNEWVDCHVFSKNNGLYTPTERLQAVRALFVPVPGQTLGGRKKQVLAEASDPANPAYVENIMWMESQVVCATLNLQGSNDDPESPCCSSRVTRIPSASISHTRRPRRCMACIRRIDARDASRGDDHDERPRSRVPETTYSRSPCSAE